MGFLTQPDPQIVRVGNLTTQPIYFINLTQPAKNHTGLVGFTGWTNWCLPLIIIIITTTITTIIVVIITTTIITTIVVNIIILQ